MEPKKVIINYALLCKELEKTGQDERKILGRTREKQVFCLQYGKEPGTDRRF